MATSILKICPIFPSFGGIFIYIFILYIPLILLDFVVNNRVVEEEEEEERNQKKKSVCGLRIGRMKQVNCELIFRRRIFENFKYLYALCQKMAQFEVLVSSSSNAY